MTKFAKGSAAVWGAAAGVAIAAIAVPAMAFGSTSSTPGAIAVYQGKVVNQQTVLGPQSAPTLLTRTAVLAAGTYTVTADVGAVISSHDQIVCATYPSSSTGYGNDGVFGTAGNPGTGAIYGTAAMTDTVHVNGSQRINVVCNSFNYGLGTYAGSAVVEAVPTFAVH